MKALYMGKPVDEMTKEELIKALENMSGLYNRELRSNYQQLEK